MEGRVNGFRVAGTLRLLCLELRARRVYLGFKVRSCRDVEEKILWNGYLSLDTPVNP